MVKLDKGLVQRQKKANEEADVPTLLRPSSAPAARYSPAPTSVWPGREQDMGRIYICSPCMREYALSLAISGSTNTHTLLKDLISMYEKHLKLVNPGVRNIQYSVRDFNNYLDHLADACALVYVLQNVYKEKISQSCLSDAKQTGSKDSVIRSKGQRMAQD